MLTTANKTEETKQSKFKKTGSSIGKGTLADVAVLTVNDYDRILKNATMSSKEELLNSKKLIHQQNEQKNRNAKVILFN